MLTLAAGCATTPDTPVRDAPLPVPGLWTTDSGPPDSVQPWLQDIDDERLHRLVATAVRQNFDLRAAAARVEAAQARARIRGADRLPALQLAVDGARTRRSDANNAGLVDNPVSSFGFDLQLSWELDVWDRLADASRGALADAQASEADFHAARLSLAAAIARGWFNAIEAQQQVRLARQTVTSFEASRDIVAQQYRSGIGNALDLRLARADAATAMSNLRQRERDRDAAIRDLESILGRYPAASLSVPEQMPRIKYAVPAGLPSELIGRRPDLLAAERRLYATESRLSEARKNRLPRFRLTANGGTASAELRNLLDWDVLVWSLVGDILQPLFQGGRLEAEQALAQADNREALAQYAQSVLTALREVETALAAETFLSGQEEAVRRSALESREASSLALERYQGGLTDIITLLESQRRAFNSESSLLTIVNLRLQNRINLYLGLGGDYRDLQADELAAGHTPVTEPRL
jgi:NodT family efflux transporter outer membrane factor (OMF) lipoprotein